MSVRVLGLVGFVLLATSACGSAGSKPSAAEEAFLQRVDHICKTDKSGGESWDDRIEQVFLDIADKNGSGDIDTLPELQLVPCSVWRRMDLGVHQEQDAAFMTIYGFHPRLIWVGSAIGINESLRDLATAQLQGCGLDAGMN